MDRENCVIQKMQVIKKGKFQYWIYVWSGNLIEYWGSPKLIREQSHTSKIDICWLMMFMKTTIIILNKTIPTMKDFNHVNFIIMSMTEYTYVIS